MKYLPLVWAALRRKPVRTVMTFLSVTVAFTLFGLMIGLNATMNIMAEKARADRIWTLTRFDNPGGIPITVARRIEKMPGIARVTVMNAAGGYVGDPRNTAGIMFIDDVYGSIFPDQIPPAAAAVLRRDRTAIAMSRPAAERHNKKVGDRFVLVSEAARADGKKTWEFTVGHIWDPSPQFPGPMIVGAYAYYDNAVPLSDRGKINEVDILTTDGDQSPAIAERIDRMFANSPTPTSSLTEKMVYSPGDQGLADQARARRVAIVGLLMILFLTANVIANSVRERFVEFAALRTMGFSTLTLSLLVAVEAAVPCLAGAAAGIGLAALLAPQIPNVMPRDFGIPLPTMAPPVLLWALGCAALLALLSAALPILRLSRLDVAAVLSGRR
jgi:putative ABC transport system permease protein